MNINRNNYELYFLMYVDNELSLDDRDAVVIFVNKNPDLEIELDLLQGTTLPSEEITFVPKTLLYKNATEAVSVQQSLLLHLDNELSVSDAVTVQSQITSNALIDAEWNILQKTKLDAKERIIFRDKRLLYRHSNNIVRLKFWRVAAAAILAGTGLFIGISIYNKNIQANRNIATNKPVEFNNKVKGSSVTISIIPANKTNPIIATNTNKRDSEVGNKNSSTGINKASDDIVYGKNDNTISQKYILKNINTEPGIQTAPIVKNKEEDFYIDKSKEVKIEKPVNDIVKVIPPSGSNEINMDLKDTEIGEVRESFARLAINEAGSNNRILYMDEDKVSRSRLGGLFRKVKRVVERNTKIKTSNGLRIGGFEFAVK